MMLDVTSWEFVSVWWNIQKMNSYKTYINTMPDRVWLTACEHNTACTTYCCLFSPKYYKVALNFQPGYVLYTFNVVALINQKAISWFLFSRVLTDVWNKDYKCPSIGWRYITWSSYALHWRNLRIWGEQTIVQEAHRITRRCPGMAIHWRAKFVVQVWVLGTSGSRSKNSEPWKKALSMCSSALNVDV